MPSTLSQWLWFVFYTAGALGGWAVIALMTADKIRAWRDK